jgi:hypothetical protein
VTVPGPDFDATSYFHVECFRLPRKFTTGSTKISMQEFVRDYLTDTTDTQCILPQKSKEIVQQLEEAATSGGGAAGGSAKKRVKSEEDDTAEEAHKSLMGRLKAEWEGASSASKKAKKSSGDDQELREMLEVYEEHYKSKADSLKEILRYVTEIIRCLRECLVPCFFFMAQQNNTCISPSFTLSICVCKYICISMLCSWNKQVLSGTKDFILFKVMDGQLNGRLGVCAMDGGRLKFEEDGDGDFRVVCSGRFDEETQTREPCSFSAPRHQKEMIPRLQPWYQEEPTEEEKEAMTKEMEQARVEADGGGGDSASGSDNPVLVALLGEVKSMSWDLSNKAGIKQATQALVDVIGGKLDLPEGKEARMVVGPIVLSNQDKTPEEILQLVVDKFGFAEEKKKKSAAKEAKLEGLCNCPKNAPLLMAFQELSKLYFKSKCIVLIRVGCRRGLT